MTLNRQTKLASNIPWLALEIHTSCGLLRLEREEGLGMRDPAWTRFKWTLTHFEETEGFTWKTVGLEGLLYLDMGSSCWRVTGIFMPERWSDPPGELIVGNFSDALEQLYSLFMDDPDEESL